MHEEQHQQHSDGHHEVHRHEKERHGGEEIEVIELVIIEDYCWADQPPPRARRYRIRVDKTHLEFDHEWVTGRQILEAAKLTPPEQYILREIFANAPPEKIGLDERVHLRKHGVEKFRTMKKTAQDG